MGISIGGFFLFQLTCHIGVRAGLNFEQKGEQLKDLTFTDATGNELTSGALKLNLDYFQAPVLIEFSGGKKLRWFANGGLSYGHLNKAEYKYPFPVIDDKDTFDAIDVFTREDYSIVLGGGGRLPLTHSLSLNLEARSYFSQNNILKTDEFSTMKNRSVSLLAGLLFHFGK